MKKIIKLSILSLILLSATMGCTTYHYDVFNPDGTLKESFSYSRPPGKKDIKGLKFKAETRDSRGSILEKRDLAIQGLSSNEEELIKALSAALKAGVDIGKLAATGGVPVP